MSQKKASLAKGNECREAEKRKGKEEGEKYRKEGGSMRRTFLNGDRPIARTYRAFPRSNEATAGYPSRLETSSVSSYKKGTSKVLRRGNRSKQPLLFSISLSPLPLSLSLFFYVTLLTDVNRSYGKDGFMCY